MLVRWFIAAAIALAIPVASWTLLAVAESSIESQWLAAVESEFGDIPAADHDDVRLAVLCADAEAAADLAEACNDTRIIAALSVLSIVSLVLSALLILITGGIAYYARGSRPRLAAVFRPGLLFLLVGLAVLLVLQGIIVVGALFEVQAAVAGRYLPFVLFGIGAAVAVGILGVLRAMVAMLRSHPVQTAGLTLDPSTDAALFAEVDAIASRVGTPPPDIILAGLDPNFFVVDAEVASLDGKHEGQVLYISVPLSRLLSKDEWRAVIGHELGHFRGEDTAYSRAFAPAYAAGRESLGTLTAAVGHWSGLAMLPATKLLEAFFLTVAADERGISRERELAADVAGAEVASPAALASALVKLHATAGAWDDAVGDLVRAIESGRATAGFVEGYLRRARATAPQVRQSDRQVIPHPFDTHPDLATRLDALGVDAETAAALADDLAPVDPASTWFADRAALEARLDGLLEERIRVQLNISIAGRSGDPAATVYAAAERDSTVEALLALFADSRGPDMARPVRPGERWVALADLVLVPHPDAHAFRSLVRLDELPAGEQMLIADLAEPHDERGDVLVRGTFLRPVGYNAADARLMGLEEDLYLFESPEAGPRLVVARGVGPTPIEQQVAGLLVVPESDQLVAQAQAVRRVVQRHLAKRRAASAP